MKSAEICEQYEQQMSVPENDNILKISQFLDGISRPP